ncbi:hypothetical protein [Parafrankia elaeagni]|uniref:hypothetical protein n=1 Tax=Parafrankia elaeagni TaxID=222534 RepID=UPI000377C2DB|nr:hypothetical protein [Parafrankia elaeagni]
MTFTVDLLKRFGTILADAAPPSWAKRIRAVDPFTPVWRSVRHDSVKLTYLSASKAGGVCGVQTDGVPARFDAAAGKWNSLPTTGLPKGGLKMAVVPFAGTMYGIDAENKIATLSLDSKTAASWVYDKSHGEALSIAASPDADLTSQWSGLYRVGTDNSVSMWVKNTNQPYMWIPAKRSAADHLAVLAKRRLWCCSDGKGSD